jgi:hypothetical protein
MSTVRTSLLVVGAFLSLSAMAVAAVATAAPDAVLATHTARGAVKFIDSSTLVIHQISPYAGHNMTFTMRPSTEREGDLKVGSTVVVRYEDKPDHRVATLVEVEHARVAPHTSPSH